MEFLRRTAKYKCTTTKGFKTIKELKTQVTWEKINNYKNKWIQHVHRIDRSQLPHGIIKYQPEGNKNAHYRDSWIFF
jgi:hypothetical protein